MTDEMPVSPAAVASEVAGLAAHLLWPARCAGCDAFVPRGTSFCGECSLTLARAPSAVCPRCALPATLPRACADCRRQPPPYAATVAALAYGGALTQALLRLKHGRRADLARPLGACLAPALHRALAATATVDAMLPVPLHPRRLRSRGFNQALELARAARRHLAPGIPRPPLWRNLLRRTSDTPPLGHHGPAARRALLAGAFQVRPRHRARAAGKRFLLIDDVMTTGATVAGCAEALLAAGAAEVHLVVLARAYI